MDRFRFRAAAAPPPPPEPSKRKKLLTNIVLPLVIAIILICAVSSVGIMISRLKKIKKHGNHTVHDEEERMI